MFEAFTSFEGTHQRHVAGSPHPERYNPDAWVDEFAFLNRPGGDAFKRDIPTAEIHQLDAGHFALDEKVDEIAQLMLGFLEGLKR